MSLALRDVTGRRKSLLLITEGSAFGAGMSDMMNRRYAKAGATRVMQEALAAATVGNVAIYPLNPAGLDTADGELVQGFGEVKHEEYLAILEESRHSSEMTRDLASMTGGGSLVDTNDALAGVDRVLRDASHHYVMSYEPATAPRGSEVRRIDVRVKRPGVRVLARRGYQATSAKPPPPLDIPSSLSPQLRTLLSGVVPDEGLPMRVQAVPLTRQGRATVVAVIIEIEGSALTTGATGRQVLAIDQGLLTIDEKGKAHNGTRRSFDLALSATQWEVLRLSGLRSVWAVDLPPGRHQLRVAAFDKGADRGGSLYVDVDVPRNEPSSPGVLVASRFLSVMPTPFVDQAISRWTSDTPTATRVFPQGDVLTVTVPHRVAAGAATGRLTAADGRLVWQGESEGINDSAVLARIVVPLDAAPPGVYELAVDSSHGTSRVTIGVVGPAPR